MAQTLFEKYGVTTIRELATTYYGKAQDSDLLSRYFENLDMDELIDTQEQILGWLLGGPMRYSNKELEQAYRLLEFSEMAFEEMIALLKDALYKLYFDEPDIDFLEEQLRQRKRFIVAIKPAQSA